MFSKAPKLETVIPSNILVPGFCLLEIKFLHASLFFLTFDKLKQYMGVGHGCRSKIQH